MTKNSLKDTLKRMTEIDRGIPERIAKNMSDDELKSFRDDLRELNNGINLLMMLTIFVEAVAIGIGILFSQYILGLTVDEMKDSMMMCVIILYFTLGIMIPYGLMSSRITRYTKLMEKRYYKEKEQ